MQKNTFFVFVSIFLCTSYADAFWKCSISKKSIPEEAEELVTESTIDDTIQSLPTDSGTGKLHLIHEAITTVKQSTNVTKLKHPGVRQACLQFTTPQDSDVLKNSENICTVVVYPPTHVTFATITLLEMGKQGSKEVQPGAHHILSVKPGTSLTTTLTLDKTFCADKKAIENGYTAIQAHKKAGKKDTFSIPLSAKAALITEFAAMAKKFAPYRQSAGDSVEVRKSTDSESNPCEHKTN